VPEALPLFEAAGGSTSRPQPIPLDRLFPNQGDGRRR
jgi:hypothetical protein